MYANVRSLCNTPETNIIFYINYISLEKKPKGEHKSIGVASKGQQRSCQQLKRGESYFAREYPRGYP